MGAEKIAITDFAREAYRAIFHDFNTREYSQIDV